MEFPMFSRCFPHENPQCFPQGDIPWSQCCERVARSQSRGVNLWRNPLMGVSINGGSPKSWMVMENPIKMDDLGVIKYGMSHKWHLCWCFLFFLGLYYLVEWGLLEHIEGAVVSQPVQWDGIGVFVYTTQNSRSNVLQKWGSLSIKDRVFPRQRLGFQRLDLSSWPNFLASLRKGSWPWKVDGLRRKNTRMFTGFVQTFLQRWQCWMGRIDDEALDWKMHSLFEQFQSFAIWTRGIWNPAKHWWLGLSLRLA